MFMDLMPNVQKFVFLVQTGVLTAKAKGLRPLDPAMEETGGVEDSPHQAIRAVAMAMTVDPEKLPLEPKELGEKANLFVWLMLSNREAEVQRKYL